MLPLLPEGSHIVSLPADRLQDIDGQLNLEFSSSFVVDVTSPRVIESSIAEGAVVTSPPTTYIAKFDEDLDASQLDLQDVALVDGNNAEVPINQLIYDFASRTIQVGLPSLPPGEYELTLRSGIAAIQDLAGNALDGESQGLTGIPSGDGIPGGDFSIHFSVIEAFRVVASDPADASLLTVAPSSVTLDFSDAVDQGSLAPTDLVVDGGAVVATQVELLDADTVRFVLPALADGLHQFELPAGAVLDNDGQQNEAYAGAFTVDTVAPRVDSTSVAEGSVLVAGAFQFIATFSEPLDPTTLDAADIVLTGNVTGQYPASTFTYDEGTRTLTADFDAIVEDIYTLVLLSGDDAVKDLAGNALDGEFQPPTGDGLPGGDFTLHFSVDQSEPTQVALVRQEPLGSRVAATWRMPGVINRVGDADLYSLELAAGELMSVVITPSEPSAVMTLEIVGSTFPLVSAGPGQSIAALIPQIEASGTTLVRIKSDVATQFYLDVAVNALLENASGDSTQETPINLELSRQDDLPGRLAALANSAPIATVVEPLGAESNDTLATAIISGIGYGNDVYASTGVIGDNSQLAALGLDVDFVQVELSAADSLVIDLDTQAYTDGLDGVLALFDSQGTLLALNDDANGSDPHLEYTASERGVYYVAVSGFANLAYDPTVAGSGYAGSTGQYDLSIVRNDSSAAALSSIVVPDDDYFSVDLTGFVGRRIDFAVVGQNRVSQVDGVLEILAPDGKTVLSTGVDGIEGVPFSNLDLAVLQFVPSVAGVYTVHFRSSTAGNYSVVAAERYLFETEPNGLLSDPLRTLDFRIGAYGYLGTVNNEIEAWAPLEAWNSTSLTQLSVAVESEPNNAIADATPIALGFEALEDTAVDVSGTLANASDVDFYRIDLRPGDVLGVSVDGSANFLSLRDHLNFELLGSDVDVSDIYPDASPLPGGGTASLARVIDREGAYFIAVSGTTGAYDLQLRVYRPTLENELRGVHQTLFIDFDGADIDRSIFGVSGTSAFSPLSDFLSRWGLTAADEDAVIDAIMGHVVENFADIGERGFNGDFATTRQPGDYAVEILNSRDHADPWGQENVTRIVVGGTTDQLGIFTLGLAESIDVGNFDTSETAVVLLDLLSEAGGTLTFSSLNSIHLAPLASKIDLIGTVVGNIASHEAAHLFGAFHTDRFNPVSDVTDQGGNISIFAGMVGNVWGDGDEIDVDFVVDTYSTNEIYDGNQDSLNTHAFGLSTGILAGALVGPAITDFSPLARFIP
ncbi:MAG: Ig-like domain-containing protein, partial [Planctomycetales bacterium]|nr:Ig-like domain-containing protein [Planctomycetales bacterium]